MQKYQNGFKRSQRKLSLKMEYNDTEAAGILLANKLYSDYMDTIRKFPEVEAEHFSEAWIEKTVPTNYRTMNTSIWKHFLCRLIEARKGRK